MTTTRKVEQSYTLKQDKVCKSVVKYSNSDGVSFYAPKPVAGLTDPPEAIELIVREVK
jgi:hypothetical protein